ncbi:berberine bridge enzyme [Colletotrichum musicola]|uniref:Berberine bridge enzyme n=1 Tax=Colletotrichum musicola TaxID=2175873 RepID=A0A8H6KQR9_9PEZI|nr:berberine bridge enzyme [Colletotrichum musicola]
MAFVEVKWAAPEQFPIQRRERMFSAKRVAAGLAIGGLAAWYFLGLGPLLPRSQKTLESCLSSVCDDCVRFENDGVSSWIRPFNLDRTVAPAAVVRPRKAREVAGVVKCAARLDVKVQAASGMHSFANHGLGGDDGAISVDMHHFQHVEVDAADSSYNVRVGGGARLSQVHHKLLSHGRAIPQGVCGDIGMGGHATVGGIGPTSRLWGTTLDHVQEVEVVTANGTLVRASEHTNSDLFFALRGAGASFGIVTEFVMRTHAAPKEVHHYSYNYHFSTFAEMADAFRAWQKLATDPDLDNRLGTEFTLTPLGARLLATWYGTEEEIEDSGILDRLPAGKDGLAVSSETWESSSAKLTVEESRHIQTTPDRFLVKSLGFTLGNKLSNDDIEELFSWIQSQDQGASFWSIKFTAAGGAVADVPTAATAYAHRDKVMFYQSYTAGCSKATRDLLEGFHRKVLDMVPGEKSSTYPGFADPELRDPQEAYWGSNLAALEEVKLTWDPKDVFHNPQSVRPIKA